jgi:DhnA family fructose-bisphosphate aldolase class Ia
VKGSTVATAGITSTRLKEPLGVDQDIVHSGAASFTPNPMYVDPDNLVRLATEGGCNAIQDAYLSDDVTIAQRRARRRAR